MNSEYPSGRSHWTAWWILWIAQGFGLGRIRYGPGTFGSVLGIGWFLLLFSTHNLFAYFLGTVLGIVASVWFCGEAEKVLGQKDPGSIILDEIVALPVCFAGWLIPSYKIHGQFPHLPAGSEFFWLMLLVFCAFRFFDIVKPWPVRQIQSLPGGWGVTMDDILAAIYVLLLTWGISWMRGW
jgi:phosphatidylglycerophosphatase A